MLNKLHFDFRNAKPAFLGVSFCMLDDDERKPVVEQRIELGCGENMKQAECSPTDAVSDNGADNNTGQLVAGSAVQVDDGDSEGLDVLDAAVVPRRSCSIVKKFEPLDTKCLMPAISRDYIEFTEQLQPSCSAPQNEILQPSDASVCSSVSASPYQLQMNKQIDFPVHRKSSRKSKWTDRTVAENQTAARVADSTVLKPLPLLVSESSSCKDSVTFTQQSTNHSIVGSSGNGGCSSNSPIVLYDDDDFYEMTLTEKARVVQSVNGVKKSPKSKNVHSLRNVTAASVKLEPKCKGGKLKVVRVTKRRRRRKLDLDDEVWSMQKKLLIMPGDKKFSKSGRGGKWGVRRNSFRQIAKSKGHNSVSVDGMELPDLSTTLDNDSAGTDMSDLLKVYDGEPEEDSTVSRKWYVDVTGADLDIDYKSAMESSEPQKCIISNKAAEQNVSELLPKYATHSEYHHTNFSGSQETPPPSVASSDNCSLCDEPDESVNSNVEDSEMQESADTKWLTIYMKLAHYIDGRHFDRLVNGVTVQVSTTVTDDAVTQLGQECLRLAKLTKRDVKQLQDQVRLEEIYHRRVKKPTLSQRDYSRKNVKCRSSPRHNVSRFIQRSAAKHAIKSQGTDNNGIETGAADAQNQQQGVPYFDSDKLCSLAAVTDADTVPHRSSADSEVVKLINLIHKPGGFHTDELLIADEAADHDHVNIDGAKQRESDKVDTDVCISRHTSAANQSRMLGQVYESTPSGVVFRKQTFTMNNCIESDECEPMAAVGSPDECRDDFLQQVFVTDDALLQKCNSFELPNNNSAVDIDGTQHAVMPGIATATDVAGTDSNEYMAAVALASLSVVTESQLHSTHHLLSSESKPCTDAKHQINKQHKLTQRAIDSEAVTSKPAEELLQHLSKPSKARETTSIQPSKQASTSNSQRSKAREKTSHCVSATDKQHERSSRVVGDAVNEHTRSTSNKQRSRGQKSHYATTAVNQKPVEEGKKKLSTTRSPKSAITFDSDSSHVAINSVDKKNAGSAGTASLIFPKSDKTKLRRESSRNSAKKAVDCRKRKQVAGDSSLSCDSISSLQPLIKFYSVTDVSIGESDLPARGENALPLGDTAVTVSVGGSASTSVLCSSSPSLLSHLSPPLLSPPLNSIYSIVKRSNKGTKISLRLRRTNPPMSSLTSENSCVEEKNEQDGKTTTGPTTTGCGVFSDLNSIGVSESSQMLPSIDDTNPVQVASGKADTDASLSAMPAGEIVSHSCSNLLQSSVVMDNYTQDMPAFPYREPEDIRSPSPVPGSILEDNHAREIRSPSPCDVESPQEVFHIIETSWDVRLSSPCEIQSPDISDDEANDSIRQFNGHCNVCFQHGPLTIPLNMEETMP